MPVVFRQGGRRFLFYSREGEPPEPIHMHVEGPEGRAKFWLNPEVHAADVREYPAHVVARLIKVIGANRELIERRWNEHLLGQDGSVR